MAAVLGRTEVGIREFGTTVTIPSNPTARLMYYLDCICVVLDLSDSTNINKLRSYHQHYLLSEAEIDALVSLCFILSPDELKGKALFQDDDMCGDSNNQFFELTAVRRDLLISESIVIGGQRRAVHKIMAYKVGWIITNWVNPMQHFAPRLARIARGEPAPAPRPAIAYHQPTPTYGYQQPTYNAQQGGGSGCCTIL